MDVRLLQNELAQILVLGDSLQPLVHVGGVDFYAARFMSGASKLISSSSRSMIVYSRRAPMFCVLWFT